MNLTINPNENYEYSLDSDKANELLKNVFMETGVRPNSMPLEHLKDRKKKRLPLYIVAYTLVVICFLTVLLIPTYFICEYNSLETPEFLYHTSSTDTFTAYFDMDSQGIDFDKCYCIDTEGLRHLVSGYDKDMDYVSFDCDKTVRSVHLFDYLRNEHIYDIKQ